MQRLAALIVLLAFGTAAYAQTLPEPRTIKINDRVYVLLGKRSVEAVLTSFIGVAWTAMEAVD